MPFVPGFQVDVFVSYATANNQPLSDDDDGWVTAVRDLLKKMLDEGLGRRGASEVWMDYKLRGNESFDDALREKVEQSAVMLVFLSEAYLESECCRRELEIFADANDGGRGRIFLIHYEPVPPGKWPKQLKGLSSEKYQFYAQERDGAPCDQLGWPVPNSENPGHSSFFARMRELRHDLVAQLKKMKSSAQPTSNLPPLPASPPQPADPDSAQRAAQHFIGELLVAAICDQLNSGREPSRRIRERLIRLIKNDPNARGDVVDPADLTKILSDKLNDVVQELYQCVKGLNTPEHVDDLKSLTASIAATAVNRDKITQLKEQLDQRHLRVPEFAHLPLCEAVLTALFQEPAVRTTERALDQHLVFGIETAATLPKARNQEIRRRIVELYFKRHVPRGVGQDEGEYARMLDEFAARKLPAVLKTALEDREPWFILFVNTAATVTQGFANDPDFWRHVLKVESTAEGNDVLVPDVDALLERLRKIYEHFDKLQGKP